MATPVRIAPMNRIEGHLDVDMVTDSSIAAGVGGVVTSVKNQCMMFRGFENIMIKRDPRDAPIITARI
jgi:hydrogenase large subunit